MEVGYFFAIILGYIVYVPLSIMYFLLLIDEEDSEGKPFNLFRKMWNIWSEICYFYTLSAYFLPALIWTIAIATDPVNARTTTVPTNAFLLFYGAQWGLGAISAFWLVIEKPGVEEWFHIRVELGLDA